MLVLAIHRQQAFYFRTVSNNKKEDPQIFKDVGTKGPFISAS